SIRPRSLREAGIEYMGDANPDHPLLSPVGADLSRLPPMLVHVGGLETMLDDALVFAERAKAAGVSVEYEMMPGMWHVWHSWAQDVPEAREALDKVGAFVKSQMA